MSSGLMFDKIIISMIRNYALEYHLEGVDIYFTNIEKNRTYMYRGHFNIFTGRKSLLKVLMLHVYISIFKESKRDNI